ncbi:hypothetical protein LIER_38314 [Lithospermum erythrorhizon]|uniref:Helitron helicase-like domain-containing protein n=1 Tax=Lithospermum erythrorhizon TaxID=34254 RepID=A0AAV3PXW2_LITER
MRHRYLDSMALLQPELAGLISFTITCNLNWPEIKECLQPGEEAHNRPDLVTHVFKAKLSVLHDKIMKGRIFGEVVSLVYVIEFQKRGFPHAHFLVILAESSKLNTPEAYDRIVCAELPEKDKDPYLFNLVVKHMMHGPCGALKPDNVCMREGKCKSHYPKEFAAQTSHRNGRYPIYRSRDTGVEVQVRGQLLDTCWIVPYNPTLLAEFDCHFNVEICCDIRVVKYLYKYVYKGHDKVAFRIAPEGERQDNNEIQTFQRAR